MKHLTLILLVFLVSCSNLRRPASVNGHPAAYGSMAWGNIKGMAIKKNMGPETCFDVELTLTGTKKDDAKVNNWTMAWVDKSNQYHLVTLRSREPASEPQGGIVAAQYGEFQQWKNEFSACTSKARLDDIKSLILTPKSSTYSGSKGLELNWN